MTKKLILMLSVLLVMTALFVTACGSQEELIEFNHKISGSAAGGDTATYAFQGEEGMHIFFHHISGDASAQFKLVGPNEMTVFQESGASAMRANAGPITLQHNGTYTLTIEPRDEALNYEFAVWLVDPLVIEGGNVEFDQRYSAEITIPGQTAEYNFEGKIDQNIYFQHISGNAPAQFRLIGPDGMTVFEESGASAMRANAGPITLSREGTYTLVIDPRDAETLQYEFALRHVDPLVIDGGLIEFGKLTGGETTIPGQTVEYIFEGVEGQAVTFTQESGNAHAQFRLIGPDGMTVFEESGASAMRATAGPLTLQRNGTYTLIVDPSEDETLQYEFIMDSDQIEEADDGDEVEEEEEEEEEDVEENGEEDEEDNA